MVTAWFRDIRLDRDGEKRYHGFQILNAIAHFLNALIRGMLRPLGPCGSPYTSAARPPHLFLSFLIRTF